ncbi:Shr3 amino acid permease chaperone [Phaffia rhodozyma]|uniref:Shr3 amino acid permease chaperone n=1 Tax=Phaffia rhodozyma TaxID=264483 RepID=A0A0F7SQM7_PHARH|nr:Shr3 amino acid permease chaperone [Phaffia rhodozyma]
MVSWTTCIITSTAFLLGTTSVHWIADGGTLWRSPVTNEALLAALTYYSSFVSAPPIVFYTWSSACFIAVTAITVRVLLGWKGVGGRGRSGEFLFDGASLFLFVYVLFTHIESINPSYQQIPRSIPSPLPSKYLETRPELIVAIRDLAASHAITAVALTGVLIMQGARYYSTTYDTSDVPDSSLLSPVSPSASSIDLVRQGRSAAESDEVKKESPTKLNASPVSRSSGSPRRSLTASVRKDGRRDRSSTSSPRRSTRLLATNGVSSSEANDL